MTTSYDVSVWMVDSDIETQRLQQNVFVEYQILRLSYIPENQLLWELSTTLKMGGEYLSEFTSMFVSLLFLHMFATLITYSNFLGCSSTLAAKKRAAAAIWCQGKFVKEWNT